MKAMEDWSTEGQYTGLDVCTSSLDIFHCMLFLSANEHKLVKADKTFAAPCILLPDKKKTPASHFLLRQTQSQMLLHLFLQLKVANRQNCLNAGAKPGTPPRVGAERLADVRNLSLKLGFSSSLSICSTLCVKNGVSSKQFGIHSKRFVNVPSTLEPM